MSEAKVIISEIEKNVPIIGQNDFVVGSGFKAKKGRSFRPIVKTSYESFVREYGTADPLFGKDHYCIEDTFAETSAMLLCRVHNGGTLASAAIPAVSGTDVTPSDLAGLAEDESGITPPAFAALDYPFAVAAIGAGISGNGYSVSISAGASDTFFLAVYDGTTVLETFEVSRILKLDAAGSQMFLEERINDISEHIIVFNNALIDNAVLPAVTSSNIPLSGGTDGTAVADTDYIKALPILFGAVNLGLPKLQLYIDNGVATQTYTETAMTYAKTNRSFVICSIPEAIEKTGEAAVVSYRTTITKAGMEGSYGALYTAWQKGKDLANNIQVMRPFVGKVASVFAKAAKTGEAPAGADIGGFTTSGPNAVYDSAARSILYNADVNSYRQFPTEGTVVWGQKTLHGDNNSAFSRINARLLFNKVEDALEARLGKFAFKYVNQNNLDQFADAARAYLRSLLRSKEIQRFEVIAEIGVNNTVQSIASREFIVDVYIYESIAAEALKLYMVRTQFGFDITEG